MGVLNNVFDRAEVILYIRPNIEAFGLAEVACERLESQAAISGKIGRKSFFSRHSAIVRRGGKSFVYFSLSRSGNPL